MQIKAIYRGARISAFKCREVTRAIRGMPVSAALDLLAFTPKKAALLVAKTLKSAIANAENNANLRADKLTVHEATVGEGPTMKRFRPRARGSAGPILKRTSHIRIVVCDDVESPDRQTAKNARAARKKAGGTKSKTKKASAANTAETTEAAPAATE
jgi:large subunit ribosomal protein L22